MAEDENREQRIDEREIPELREEDTEMEDGGELGEGDIDMGAAEHREK